MASRGSVIALFVLVSGVVTASSVFAVGSASAGFPVRVQKETKIALFSSFLNTISANWDWWGAWSNDVSRSEGLDWSGSFRDTVSGVREMSVLEVGHALDLIEDDPLQTGLARWVGVRSSVGVKGVVAWDSEFQRNLDSGLSSSAVVGNTEFGASVPQEVVVLGSLIASFTVGGINDTITAIGESAVGSASVGGSVAVVGTVVALFESVNDSITTEWEFAVGSASVGSVGIVSTEIALLIEIEASVSAFRSARGIATISSEVVAIITAFT